MLYFRYRLAVIRALPQLQKLDNIQISPDELKEAQRKGRVLTHPDEGEESEEEYAPQYSNNRYQENNTRFQEYQEQEYQASPTRQEVCRKYGTYFVELLCGVT